MVKINADTRSNLGLLILLLLIVVLESGCGWSGTELAVTPEPSFLVTPPPAAKSTTSSKPGFSNLNYDILPPPANIPKPAVSVPFIDPVFKTRITRITDAKASSKPGLFPIYSKFQAWNSDESLLLLRSDDGSVLLYDGASYKFIKALEPVGGEDIFWHPVDPALILYNPGHELWVLNIKTDENYRVFDFAGFEFAHTRGEGNLSRDGACYAVVCSTYDASSGDVQPVKLILLSLTQAQGKITGKIEQSMNLPKSVQDMDWISVSPNGKYIVVDYADDITGRYHGVEVYDCTFKFLWQKPLGWGHSDLGIDGNGDDCLVMDVYNADTNKTVFMKCRLSDGLETRLIETNSFYYQHLSCRNTGQPGWCLISTFDNVGRLTDSPATWLPFEDEIFLLKMDGSGETRRIAHHHSRRYSPNTPDSDTSVYWAEPHASISRNGDRILYGSNWGLNVDKVESVDTYLVDLR